MRFILVDDILDLEPGKKIVATKAIALDEDYFADHFPGFPVVPGVLLTEMMAQAAGQCLLAEDRSRGRPMLMQVKSATFKRWVGPGSDVVLEATILSSRRSVATASCRATVADQEVASADMRFTFVPSEQFSSKIVDRPLERYMAQKNQAQR